MYKLLSTYLASYPGPYTHTVCASFRRRNKGLVSTVLCMCQFKTNEYTQITLLGVELLRVTFYVWIFPLNLPQVGNLECNNMASTNVCHTSKKKYFLYQERCSYATGFPNWYCIFLIGYAHRKFIHIIHISCIRIEHNFLYGFLDILWTRINGL